MSRTAHGTEWVEPGTGSTWQELWNVMTFGHNLSRAYPAIENVQKHLLESSDVKTNLKLIAWDLNDDDFNRIELASA